MKLKLIEDRRLCPVCNTPKTGLCDGQCNACGIGCHHKTGETQCTDEELLRSWYAVLSEYAPMEPGDSRW